jgi:short-subunit dehydrogenase
MDFARKVVWITGASSGIGRALAILFAGAGSELVLSGRRLHALRQVQAACGCEPDRILLLPFDLCCAPEISIQAKLALERFGRIDVLINCAGISQRSLAADTILSVDRTFMEVNYFGPVSLVKEVLPSMLARNSGHIVVISSLAGKFGTPLRSAYAASKHALHGFFDSLRAEVCRRNIYVTIVCPGFIATDITLKCLTGDGTPYGIMDESVARGMPVMTCARHIVSAIARRRQEVLVGGVEKYAVLVKRFFPRVFSRLISRSKVI